MPAKPRNSRSWFCRTRRGAGFRTVAGLAQELGVPKGKVYQWERGSALRRPSYRPPWRLMPQLAAILNVTLPELVEALWKETIGDPCPCGCGGKKVFPEQFPGARTLAIELPCAKCGTKRIHKRWKKSRHRKLCPSCPKVERIPFTCIGYQDHNATRHARKCPRTMRLRPSDISSRQWMKKRFPTSRFDLSSRTYQCNSCAGAERLIAVTEARLKEVMDPPKEQIQSGKQRRELLSTYQISPKFKPTRDAQERGRKNFARDGAAGKTWPNMTKANLIRRWSGKVLPRRIRVGLCIVCDRLVFTYGPEEPHFHWSCHQKWQTTQEGKSFQSLRVRGLKASLPSHKVGRPVKGEDLKAYYAWTIRHHLGGKSFRAIAKEENVDFSFVKDKIRSVVENLPAPTLVAHRFQRTISLICDVAMKKP